MFSNCSADAFRGPSTDGCDVSRASLQAAYANAVNAAGFGGMLNGGCTGSAPVQFGAASAASAYAARGAPRGCAGGGNAKSELAAFCQWRIGRSMGKDDIKYNAFDHNGQFQAVVSLNCMSPPEEYAGALCTNSRLATEAAATQALEAHAMELTLKMKDDCIKAKLDMCVKALLGRDLAKGDIMYEKGAPPEGGVQPEGGFLTIVRLPTIPGPMSQKTWIGGSLGEAKRDAKVAATKSAVEDLRKDPAFRPLLDPGNLDDESWWSQNPPTPTNYQMSAGMPSPLGPVSDGGLDVRIPISKTAKRARERNKKKQKDLATKTPEQLAEMAARTAEHTQRKRAAKGQGAQPYNSGCGFNGDLNGGFNVGLNSGFNSGTINIQNTGFTNSGNIWATTM